MSSQPNSNEARFALLEQRCLAAESTHHRATYRGRTLAFFAVVLIVFAILLAPSRHTALAQGHGHGDDDDNGLHSRIVALEAAVSHLQTALAAETSRATAAEVLLQHNINTIALIPGPQGVPGPHGATGPQGPAGAIGVPGAIGPAGAIGATGAIGPAGAVGPAGAAGPAGPIGSQGSTGAAGVAGPAGPQGVQGPQGAAGPMGPAGASPFTVNGTEVTLHGYNLHIENLAGAQLADGLGNLILGYNVSRGVDPNTNLSLDVRTGSHYLVIGDQNNYTFYSGLVSGHYNTVSAPYSSVTGGINNTASGFTSSVSGGFRNTAGVAYSSVSGGINNTANGINSSISGGAGVILSIDNGWAAGSFQSP